MENGYLVSDDEPLQHPLGVLVEDVGTEGCEALPDQSPGRLLLLLKLQKHSEPHHIWVEHA